MARPVAVLFHGFNVKDQGKGTTQKLIPYLQDAGYDVRHIPMGWIGLLGVRFGNARRAQQIAKDLLDEFPSRHRVFWLFGHSNGGLKAALVSALLPDSRLLGITLINPALDQDYLFHHSNIPVRCFHSPGDKAVKVSSVLAFHDWGAAGAYGLAGPQNNYTNIPMPVEFGHSGVFDNLDEWGAEIAGPTMEYA